MSTHRSRWVANFAVAAAMLALSACTADTEPAPVVTVETTGSAAAATPTATSITAPVEAAPSPAPPAVATPIPEAATPAGTQTPTPPPEATSTPTPEPVATSTATPVATPPPAPPPVAAPQVTTLDVAITGFAYGAAEGTAPLVVRWTNQDPVEHDVVATDRSVASPIIPPGGMYEMRFDQPGTFNYLCAVHPFMTASVVVR